MAKGDIMSNHTRRDFLKAGAVLAAGAGLTGMLSGYTENKVRIGAPESWTHEADLVVIGLGAAGIAAAITAQKAGGTVIILEKMDRENSGGATCCYGGNINPKAPELIKMSSFYTWDDDRANKVSEKSNEWADWQCTLGFPYSEVETAGLVSRNANEGGLDVYNHMVDFVAPLDNVEIMFETPAISLYQDGATKEILGVVAIQNGEEIAVKANKGVVLATGGYEANPDLIHSLNFPAIDFTSMGGPARTGDGMIMGAAAGGQIGNIVQNIEWHIFACRKATEEIGTGIVLEWPSTTGPVFVNAAGKRFMDEDLVLSHNKSQMPFLEFNGRFTNVVDHESRGYPNLPLWAIWDQTAVSEQKLGGSKKANETFAIAHGFEWSDDNSEEIEKGWIVKADTIEELASKLSSTTPWGDPVTVDAEGLKATIDQYNAYVEAGEDLDFSRKAENMKPVLTPPFYATEMLPNILYTMNGLVNNANSQVVDPFGEPIPRLYSAGDISQGVIFVVIGVVGCMALGQIAAEHAMALDSWQ